MLSRSFTVLVLEDDAARIGAMNAALSDSLPGYVLVQADNVAAFAAYINENAPPALISLDHDLDPLEPSMTNYGDPGDGRDAARFLAGRSPTSPVIVHTSNGDGAASMCFTLEDAGWTVARVAPTAEIDWVRRDWLPAVRELLSPGGV